MTGLHGGGERRPIVTDDRKEGRSRDAGFYAAPMASIFAALCLAALLFNR